MLGLIGVGWRLWRANGLPMSRLTVPSCLSPTTPSAFSDGIAALTLAEDLGRPFKVLINMELLKVPEFERFSLPIDFRETAAAKLTNLKTRNEAIRLLGQGTTIIVFPAGGVATAPTPFGRR
jgi:putative hemolysin